MGILKYNFRFKGGLKQSPFLFFKGGGAPSETKEQVEQAKIAQEKWDSYQTMYVPVENEFIDKVNNFDSESQKGALKSASEVAVSSSLMDQGLQRKASLMSSGVNPNSGAMRSMSNDVALGMSTASTISNASSANSAVDRAIGGLETIVAMGQGQASDNQLSLDASAKNSVQGAINKSQHEQKMASIYADGLESAGSAYAGATAAQKHNERLVAYDDHMSALGYEQAPSFEVFNARQDAKQRGSGFFSGFFGG